MDAHTTEAKIPVHARFAPDATVVEIGERPSGLTPQDWFFYLRENSDPSYFQPLSGGRGVFRIPRAEFDALKAAAAGCRRLKAPAMTQPGIEVYAICEAESIPPGGAKAFSLSRRTDEGEARPYGIVVVRVRPREFVGYLNACPHGKVWLNIGDGSFFTPDKAHLRCGRHGAKFEIASGLCLEGPCQGASLEPIPLALMGSDVCLCGIALVEDDGASGYDGDDETMDIMIHPG